MRTILFLLLGVILVGAIFLAFKPSKNGENNSSETARVAETNFELVVKEGKLASGPSVLKAVESQAVTIEITADEDEELHLHGYDKIIPLEKDVPAELSFTASLSGRFPYELHGSGTEIGVLEITPQ